MKILHQRQNLSEVRIFWEDTGLAIYPSWTQLDPAIGIRIFSSREGWQPGFECNSFILGIELILWSLGRSWGSAFGGSSMKSMKMLLTCKLIRGYPTHDVMDDVHRIFFWALVSFYGKFQRRTHAETQRAQGASIRLLSNSCEISLLRSPWAVLVNTISLHCKKMPAELTRYASSKAGDWNFTPGRFTNLPRHCLAAIACSAQLLSGSISIIKMLFLNYTKPPKKKRSMMTNCVSLAAVWFFGQGTLRWHFSVPFPLLPSHPFWPCSTRPKWAKLSPGVETLRVNPVISWGWL